MTVPYHPPHEYRTQLGVSQTWARSLQSWNLFLNGIDGDSTICHLDWHFRVSRVNNSNINSSSGNDILTLVITTLSTADGKAHWEFILLIIVSDKLWSVYCSIYSTQVLLYSSACSKKCEVNKSSSGFLHQEGKSCIHTRHIYSYIHSFKISSFFCTKRKYATKWSYDATL